MNPSGFYGKLPIKGDFVSRNLPYEFIDNWDKWLQKSLAHSQELLGDQWKEYFQHSPVWCFALATGVCLNQTAAGVIAPSGDRVDRSFPLTIVAPAGLTVDPWYLAAQQQLWYKQACQVIARRLDQNISLQTFTDQVSALELPQNVAGTAAVPPHRSSAGTDYCYAFSAQSQLDDVLRQACQQSLQIDMTAGSLWWHSGTGTIPACLLVCRNLPGPKQFAGMLTGSWQQYNWTVVDHGG
jgi:type VI secretion system protein ImpM